MLCVYFRAIFQLFLILPSIAIAKLSIQNLEKACVVAETSPLVAQALISIARHPIELSTLDESILFYSHQIQLESNPSRLCLLHKTKGILLFAQGDFASASKSFACALSKSINISKHVLDSLCGKLLCDLCLQNPESMQHTLKDLETYSTKYTPEIHPLELMRKFSLLIGSKTISALCFDAHIIPCISEYPTPAELRAEAERVKGEAWKEFWRGVGEAATAGVLIDIPPLAAFEGWSAMEHFKSFGEQYSRGIDLEEQALRERCDREGK